jgi:hypothetical protein
MQIATVRLRVSNVSIDYIAIRYMSCNDCFLFIRSTVKGCWSPNDLLNYAVSVLGISTVTHPSSSAKTKRDWGADVG